MLSVLAIFLDSLFGQKKEQKKLSFCQLYCFFRIDLDKRYCVGDMTGQLLITCSLAHIATVLTSGKNTTTRKFSEICLSRSEKLVLVIGFTLMIGAVVESIAINMLSVLIEYLSTWIFWYNYIMYLKPLSDLRSLSRYSCHMAGKP
jgi:hypothetical protein